MSATIAPERENIAAALHADRNLDLALFAYAEHGKTHDLADSIDLSRRVVSALELEAKRIGRKDLLKPPIIPAGVTP